jgi:cysteine-rich repeat protein
MPLSSAFPHGPKRHALLLLVLPLACFSGDDGRPVADTTSEGTTEETECEVATENCPCTSGGACNPGLECFEGMCREIVAVCGNGIVEPGEECDDGNQDNTDECTTLCKPPSCDDGIRSGDEVDVDCGFEACGVPCQFGQACLSEQDCEFPSCGPAPGNNDAMVCELPTNCVDWLSFTPNATDGTYSIDPDGAAGPIRPMDVFCHMSKDGGGWTLIFVASDDDVNTWTWNNRAKLTTEVSAIGNLDERNRDFMSPAYHTLPFTDVLFIHQPSNVWAHYADVGNGAQHMGQVIASWVAPVCDYSLSGNGYKMVGGTLTSSGQLCDTDLYFNLGDHDMSLEDCMDFGSPSNTAAFGPVWNANNGDGCPFDDPAMFGIGPHGPCGVCPSSFASMEFNHLGYANALSLNSGVTKMAQNYLQMYVR